MAAFKPRNVAIAAGVICAGVFGVSRMGDFKTPGMQNIENRHAAAGGGHTHTPAQASPLGSQTQTRGAQLEEKGVGSKDFQDKHADQKPEVSCPRSPFGGDEIEC